MREPAFLFVRAATEAALARPCPAGEPSDPNGCENATGWTGVSTREPRPVFGASIQGWSTDDGERRGCRERAHRRSLTCLRDEACLEACRATITGWRNARTMMASNLDSVIRAVVQSKGRHVAIAPDVAHELYGRTPMSATASRAVTARSMTNTVRRNSDAIEAPPNGAEDVYRGWANLDGARNNSTPIAQDFGTPRRGEEPGRGQLTALRSRF